MYNAKHVSIFRNFVLDSVKKGKRLMLKMFDCLDASRFLTKPLSGDKLTSIWDSIGMRAIGEA